MNTGLFMARPARPKVGTHMAAAFRVVLLTPTSPASINRQGRGKGLPGRQLSALTGGDAQEAGPPAAQGDCYVQRDSDRGCQVYSFSVNFEVASLYSIGT